MDYTTTNKARLSDKVGMRFFRVGVGPNKLGFSPKTPGWTTAQFLMLSQVGVGRLCAASLSLVTSVMERILWLEQIIGRSSKVIVEATMERKEALYGIPKNVQVRVKPLDAAEQRRRIQEAIARRAYEIFERRGGMGWHELDDWRQAEGELLHKLSYGFTTRDHTIGIGMDLSSLEPGSVEIWVAPRQLTICGKPRSRKVATSRATEARLVGHLVFREIQLPFNISPTAVETRIRGRCYLEIRLPKDPPLPAPKPAAAA